MLTAIAARLSQNHSGSRHVWPDQAKSLLSIVPSIWLRHTRQVFSMRWDTWRTLSQARPDP